jgi:AcrR family transcriptional regulator
MQSVPRRPAGPSRDEKKALTRQRLLDAAATVFARRGFNGASLDDVAEEAGLTKGAVYSNFASKEDLIDALVEERVDQPMLTITDLVDPTGSSEARAEQAGALLMSMFEQEREAYLLNLEHMTYLARNPRPDRTSHFRERVTAMAEYMQAEADADGRTLPLPAYDLAVGLFAMGQGILLERLVNPDDVPDDLFGKLIAAIFAGGPSQTDSRDQPASPASKGGKAKR